MKRFKRILASFSGGRTSADMCRQIQEKYAPLGYEIVFIMANSTQELWPTIHFARACDEHFGWGLVLVERDFAGNMGDGTGHRVVTWDTLAMKGERYEEMCQKYGIANEDYPHCTRELKTIPIHSYARSIGWAAGTYWTAIGIRADEPKRISPSARKSRFFYPLVASGTDKLDVLQYFKQFPWDLKIKEREGNCSWCWKKSLTKHILNIQHNPERYEFPALMEERYAHARSDLSPDPRYFFRGRLEYPRKTARDLIKLANALPVQLDLMLNREDEDAGCAEHCEIETIA